jgi:hypothetical protein
MSYQDGWLFECRCSLCDIRHVIGDTVPVQGFMPAAPAMAPPVDGVNLIAAGGEIGQKMFLPNPRTVKSAMDKEDGVRSGRACRGSRNNVQAGHGYYLQTG